MKKVEIYGTNLELEIDEMKIEHYTLLDYETVIQYYDETYLLDDGRRIAFDGSVNSWVMIG